MTAGLQMPQVPPSPDRPPTRPLHGPPTTPLPPPQPHARWPQPKVPVPRTPGPHPWCPWGGAVFDSSLWPGPLTWGSGHTWQDFRGAVEGGGEETGGGRGGRWGGRGPPACCPLYHHHSVQQAGLCSGSSLQPLHGPLLHDGRDVGVVHVEDAEPRQVHPRVAVGLQVQRVEVLGRGLREPRRGRRPSPAPPPAPPESGLWEAMGAPTGVNSALKSAWGAGLMGYLGGRSLFLLQNGDHASL